eukprot:GEMP01011670.1.p1 GENE.GEMP01011670.1~~GEMP01011670.1.p1  ORF type:complete len:619 (+),score=132.21 GEMP01011670.1:258-2114(+)
MADDDESALWRKVYKLKIRCYAFNMANNNAFNWDNLPNLFNGGPFEEEFQDVDLFFAVFCETRLSMEACKKMYQSSFAKLGFTQVEVINARKDTDAKRGLFASVGAKMATTIKGNLKCLLLAKDYLGVEDSINGSTKDVDVPNPCKSFMGKVIYDQASKFRICMLGAHFPISEIRAAIDSGAQALPTIKRFLAKLLRHLLKKTVSEGYLTEKTIIFLAGDLNSRTILPDAEDALSAVLEDDELQSQITQKLGVQGRWYDLTSADGTLLTYKYAAKHTPSEKPLTLEDCKPYLQPGLHRDEIERAMTRSNTTMIDEKHAVVLFSPYQQSFEALRKANIFRDQILSHTDPVTQKPILDATHHFPAAADRILVFIPRNRECEIECWASSINVGTNVMGSDHKPVALTAEIEFKYPHKHKKENKEMEATRRAQERKSAASRKSVFADILRSQSYENKKHSVSSPSRKDPTKSKSAPPSPSGGDSRRQKERKGHEISNHTWVEPLPGRLDKAMKLKRGAEDDGKVSPRDAGEVARKDLSHSVPPGKAQSNMVALKKGVSGIFANRRSEDNAKVSPRDTDKAAERKKRVAQKAPEIIGAPDSPKELKKSKPADRPSRKKKEAKK